MQSLKNNIDKMLSEAVCRIIISNPVKKSEAYKKIVAEMKSDGFHISKYTDKQVFHDNIPQDAFSDYLSELVFGHYRQINGWSDEKEHIILISQKGVCNYMAKSNQSIRNQFDNASHNRKKNYILPEGTIIAPLADMGIFTQDGKIVKSMYNKYKQINRFLEIIDDEIDKCGLKEINVIDFGCGKSYLTFILYYYMTAIKCIKVNMIGLDLKADVIDKCNKAAAKYGYSDLRFELGDINGYKAPFKVDMVISLHACDTATDYALYNAIQWGAKFIFSVPCCQHELNQQINPKTLSLLTKYGIVKERFCALATDAIRANLLEYCGYKTQVLEFIDLDHTPKNILIRAVNKGNSNSKKQNDALSEARLLIEEFGFEPTLCKLIGVI